MLNKDQVPLLFSRAALHPAAVSRADEAAKGNPEQPWCVAFSGGADSLALLLTVWMHWPTQRGRLTAIHFNHRLRGEESDADEAFCRACCARLGVNFRAGSWSEARLGASEAAARAARLSFFSEEMTTIGAKLLWTGHQKDDIAETLLMRVARGSGTAGMAAPRPVQSRSNELVFLRPLLTLSKTQITAALSSAGLVWREDASNAQRDFFRNRTRNEVMPVWRAAAENDALEGAALTRELLDEDDAALETWLNELVRPEIYGPNTLDLRALLPRPRALLRRVLRRWQPLADIGRSGFEEILEVCGRGTGRTSAGKGVVEMRDGILHFRDREAERDAPSALESVGLAVGTKLFLPAGGRVDAEAVVLTAALRERVCTGGVDPSREAFIAHAGGKLAVRAAKAGDRYHPLGAPGSAKVQDLFVNRKIPVALRKALPLVCDERGAILWIPGFSPAEDSKLTDANVTGVHLTYESGTYTVRP
jgi:tRNA(Ile)-lysidine synthase